MRRTLPFVALWFCAGALAVLIASAGVAVVDDQLTASRPAPLSAEEVHQRLLESGSTTTTESTTTSTTPAPPSTSPTSTAPSTTGGIGGSGSGGTTTPTTAPPPAAETRTYELVGGTTTIRFSPSGVTVLSSAPKPGFTAKVEPEGSGVKVEFESDAHRSRIDAWWASGPQTRVREEADD